MKQDVGPTKILFIDNDEISFQIRECIARALKNLPPIEMFHAHDATEALAMLESLNPDVVVLDDDSKEESSLFLDSLTPNHPPVLLRTGRRAAKNGNTVDNITPIIKNESLEGIHQTLIAAAELASKCACQAICGYYH